MEARLFFEFLQVAIGNRESLSRELSDNEWQDIFLLIKKHALLGVGFTAVERLHTKGIVCPAELRIKWYALAVHIERRNGLLNGLCKKVTEQYEHDGFSTCILKGQGNHLNYPDSLRERRQCGDIDIWCMPPKEGLDIAVQTGRDSVEYVKYHGVKAVIEYVKMQHRICGSNKKPRPIYHHVDAPTIEGVEVEAHFRTGYIHSPLRNWRMQRWFALHHEECAANKTSYGFSMPTPSVNVIYQITHLFSHYFQEGVGLRQILDMYYTLIAWRESVENGYWKQSQGMWSEGHGSAVMSPSQVMSVLRSFGMGKFAGAVMFVINEVFGGGNENDNENENENENDNENENENGPRRSRRETDGGPQADGEQGLMNDDRLLITDCPWLLCEPNEKEGRRLLEEIMKGGNFGQCDTRDAALKKGGMVKHGIWKLKRVMRLVRSYPEEALWEPVFRVYHLIWRKIVDY